MKKFVPGILIGTAVTVAALAGVAITIRKAAIDPIGEKEDMTGENREKAVRKRIVHRKITVTLRQKI